MREAKPLKFTPPQLATLVAKAPEGDEWLHEIKFDGYRAQIVIAEHRARVFTRSGADWTVRFRHIADAAVKLPCRSAIIDGEAVVLDDKGVSSFSKMQNAMGSGAGEVVFYAFDLLEIDGLDLRHFPLIKRKKFLVALLSTHKGGRWIQYADHVRGNGGTFFQSACDHNLEGIISKKADAP